MNVCLFIQSSTSALFPGTHSLIGTACVHAHDVIH